MPELPEVETVVRSLALLCGKEITSAEHSAYKMRFPAPQNFIQIITNYKIESVERIAKYIVIKLNNSKCIVIHLGMSGKILFNRNQPQKHDHLILKFNDDSQLVFNDARRFGLYTLLEQDNIKEHILFKNLGVEPLTEAFNANYLQARCITKSTPIKAALMENNIVVGVGNIYASESLFRAKIHPLRPAKDITLMELDLLCIEVKKVLQDAIASGGSTLRDYVRSDGGIGYFQQRLQVYGRQGQACMVCDAEINAQKVGGRSTFFCNNCQR